jgi:hypothetical protein
MSRKEDLTGLRFGHLLVLGPAPKKGGKNLRWYVQCDCGHEYSCVGSTVKKRQEGMKCNRCVKRPGKAVEQVSNCPVKRIHDRIMRQCYDKSHCEYEYFGLRGVKMWHRWEDFDLFKKYLEPHLAIDPELDFDRIDVKGDWTPDNTFLTDWLDIRIEFKGTYHD